MVEGAVAGGGVDAGLDLDAAPVGLAIQRLTAPADVDPAPLLQIWTRVVMGALEDPAQRP